jgi:hypothetical protein
MDLKGIDRNQIDIIPPNYDRPQSGALYEIQPEPVPNMTSRTLPVDRPVKC